MIDRWPHALHGREVDDEGVVDHAMAGHAVRAASHRQGGPGLGSQGHHGRDVVRVGDPDDGTLTRAMIYNNTGPIRIDFRSEAAVRLMLDEVPPADLCGFDSAEIAAIVAAVEAAPGEINAGDVESANDAATAAAAADAGVQSAIAAALQ